MRMLSLTPMGWNSRDLSADFMGEFDSFFEGLDRRTSTYAEKSSAPPVEIIESDEYYSVSLEVPGMKKEDLKIEMNGPLLTVSGERKREINSGKGERVQLLERNYGFFKRSFSLPQTVDTEKIEAACEDGILQIWLPKISTARPRQIEIKTEKSGGMLSRFLNSKKENEEKYQVV